MIAGYETAPAWLARTNGAGDRKSIEDAIARRNTDVGEPTDRVVEQVKGTSARGEKGSRRTR